MFAPRILDVLLLANHRSSSQLQIMTEYFINPEKYFHFITLHTNIANCIAMIAILGTGTMNMMYIQHACGMFMIARYVNIGIAMFES